MLGFYQFFFGMVLFALTSSSAVSSVKVIKEGNQALVERLGKYEGKKLEPGLTFLIPFIESAAHLKTLKEQMIVLPPQSCTTSDRSVVNLDLVIYWRIIDLEKACYKVEDLHGAILNLFLTELRDEIALIDYESLFTARARINEAMVERLDLGTEPWGVKITRVELRDFAYLRKLLLD